VGGRTRAALHSNDNAASTPMTDNRRFVAPITVAVVHRTPFTTTEYGAAAVLRALV
jgi:hypothetical protein